MDREQLMRFIREQYGLEEEYPWAKYPKHAVFRHMGNKKWFALIMNIPASRLGLKKDEDMDILDVKCDPALIGALRQEDGFYPAYHMNKDNWITAALDGTVDAEKIKMLIDMSYGLTS